VGWLNIMIMRAFVRLRTIAGLSSELPRKLYELEARVSKHDVAIASIVRAIRELATPPEPKVKRRIGFISG